MATQNLDLQTIRDNLPSPNKTMNSVFPMEDFLRGPPPPYPTSPQIIVTKTDVNVLSTGHLYSRSPSPSITVTEAKKMGGIDPDLEKILLEDPGLIECQKAKSFGDFSDGRRENHFAGQGWHSLPGEKGGHSGQLGEVKAQRLNVERPPSLAQSTTTSRTNVKQLLHREQCLQQEEDDRKRREEARVKAKVKTTGTIPIQEQRYSKWEEKIGESACKVTTQLEHPTRYYMLKAQERQVREYQAEDESSQYLHAPAASAHPHSAPGQPSVGVASRSPAAPSVGGASSAPAVSGGIGGGEAAVVGVDALEELGAVGGVLSPAGSSIYDDPVAGTSSDKVQLLPRLKRSAADQIWDPLNHLRRLSIFPMTDSQFERELSVIVTEARSRILLRDALFLRHFLEFFGNPGQNVWPCVAFNKGACEKVEFVHKESLVSLEVRHHVCGVCHKLGGVVGLHPAVNCQVLQRLCENEGAKRCKYDCDSFRCPNFSL